MVETTLNIFDLGVAVILGLSALLSFFRGFIREILSLGAWVGAAIITLYGFPHVAAWLEPQVKNTMVASGLAAMGTFMGSLILISLFNSLLLKYVKTGADVGLLDNGLGLMFGLARGALLISIAYFIMSTLLQEENYPDWVKEATTRPYVEDAAKWVAAVAPQYLKDMSPLDSAAPEPEGDKPTIIRRIVGEDTQSDADAEPSSRWQSLEDLREQMKGN